MTDSNMPQDKNGREAYLRARKVQLLETIAYIISNNDRGIYISVEDIATVLWEKVAEIDEKLGESTDE